MTVIVGLFLTLFLSVYALADFTVGKTMYEPFQVYGPDAAPRTNCNLSRFSIKTWRNGTSLGVQNWTFKNESTGDYTASRVPSAPGFHKFIISYSGIAIGTYSEMVRLFDVDTEYASFGPRLANISGNLVGAAAAFQAQKVVLNNMTSLAHVTNRQVGAIPTNPLLSTDTRLANLNAPIGNVPTNPLTTTDSRLNYLDASVSSRMSSTLWTQEVPVFNSISSTVHKNSAAIAALPSASSVASAVWGSGSRTLTGFGTLVSDIWNSGNRTLTSGGTAFVNSTGIDNYLTSKHGTGLWNTAGSVTVLPFQGAASYETVAQGKDVHVTRGDSVAIPYSIGKDLTGWTVSFGAKATPEDGAYAIPPKDITAYVTAPSNGSGLINLSTVDTALPVRKYAAEVKIKNGSSVNTALKFNLYIDAAVMN